MSETANIKDNVTDGINRIITKARELSTEFKRAEFGGCEEFKVIIEGYKKNGMIDESTSYKYKIIIPINMSETANDCIKQMIADARALETYLKSAEICKQNMGRDSIRDIIVIGYCTMHFSHMSTGNLEEIFENVLGYFKTGLYDTDKISLYERADGLSFDVRSWVYTPDTHNDAGEWFYIYDFEKSEDANKCITMLKEIEGELKRLN